MIKRTGELPLPVVRPRRLRTTAAMRRLVEETALLPHHLVLPLFVAEDIEEARPIASMPGVFQHTLETMRKAAVEAVAADVGGLMVFGIPSPAKKDKVGTAATDPDGILNVAIRHLVAEVGSDMVLMADLCLDEFTDHGHCGVLLPNGRVSNDATLRRYAEMAIAQASAGVDLVSPSGMMDGQVAAIRAALDGAGFTDVGILAYAAKYASAFYGPFREAVGSTLTGDRRTYQQDPANRREGLREASLDIDEGADIVLVKPALGYLDVLADVASRTTIPVAAYNVSGEYSMIEAAAAAGYLDREAAVLEALTSIRRAGADIVLTYWAVEAARWLRERG
jgi:porphobilinogen synthase